MRTSSEAIISREALEVGTPVVPVSLPIVLFWRGCRVSLVAKVERGDVLTEVLDSLGLEGRVFCRAELSAPWSLALPPSEYAPFHVLERGAGWVRLDGEGDALALAPGDLVIVPHGGGHVLCDDPDTPPVRLETVLAQGTVERHFLRHDG